MPSAKIAVWTVATVIHIDKNTVKGDVEQRVEISSLHGVYLAWFSLCLLELVVREGKKT
jgi:hypothetical protein